jgi:iron-sulfur cluster repair protein YtfE (RIC family)
MPDVSQTEAPQQASLPLPRWWEEHSELDAKVVDLNALLEAGTLDGALSALDALEEALETHFHTEEGVYFPLIDRLLPEEAESTQAARRAHDFIRSGLADLRKELGDGDRESARNALADLLDRIRQHEVREEQLIQRLQDFSDAG